MLLFRGLITYQEFFRLVFDVTSLLNESKMNRWLFHCLNLSPTLGKVACFFPVHLLLLVPVLMRSYKKFQDCCNQHSLFNIAGKHRK